MWKIARDSDSDSSSSEISYYIVESSEDIETAIITYGGCAGSAWSHDDYSWRYRSNGETYGLNYTNYSTGPDLLGTQVPLIPEMEDYVGLAWDQELLEDGTIRIHLILDISPKMNYVVEVDMYEPPTVNVPTENRLTTMLQQFLHYVLMLRNEVPYEPVQVQAEDAVFYNCLTKDEDTQAILYYLFHEDMEMAQFYVDSLYEDPIFNLLHDYLLYIIPKADHHCSYCGRRSLFRDDMEFEGAEWVCERELCQYRFSLLDPCQSKIYNILEIQEDMDAELARELAAEFDESQSSVKVKNTYGQVVDTSDIDLVLVSKWEN